MSLLQKILRNFLLVGSFTFVSLQLAQAVDIGGVSTLTFPGCTIPTGQSKCITEGHYANYSDSQHWLKLINVTTGVTTPAAAEVGNHNGTIPVYVMGEATTLKYGSNMLQLADYTTGDVKVSATATASCASNARWNGSICAQIVTTSPVSPITPGNTDLPESGTSQCLALNKSMTFGAKDSVYGGQVSDMQFFLSERGYLKADPTGYFGQATLAAVKAFQGDNGITTNGVVGPLTRAAMNQISCIGGTVSNNPTQIPPIGVALPHDPTTSPLYYCNGIISHEPCTTTTPTTSPTTPNQVVGNVSGVVSGPTSCTILSGSNACTITLTFNTSSSMMANSQVYEQVEGSAGTYVLKSSSALGGVLSKTFTVTKSTKVSVYNGSNLIGSALIKADCAASTSRNYNGICVGGGLGLTPPVTTTGTCSGSSIGWTTSSFNYAIVNDSTSNFSCATQIGSGSLGTTQTVTASNSGQSNGSTSGWTFGYGQATFACSNVNGTAKWVPTSQFCSKTPTTGLPTILGPIVSCQMAALPAGCSYVPGPGYIQGQNCNLVSSCASGTPSTPTTPTTPTSINISGKPGLLCASSPTSLGSVSTQNVYSRDMSGTLTLSQTCHGNDGKTMGLGIQCSNLGGDGLGGTCSASGSVFVNGTQVQWKGNTSGSCYADSACENGYECGSSNVCRPRVEYKTFSTSDGDTVRAGGTYKRSWTGTAFGDWVFVECASGYHGTGGSTCELNVRTCTTSGGAPGKQVYTTSWGSCVATGYCSASNYYFDPSTSTCVPVVAACTPSDNYPTKYPRGISVATGLMTWNTQYGYYSECQVQCKTGYTLVTKNVGDDDSATEMFNLGPASNPSSVRSTAISYCTPTVGTGSIPASANVTYLSSTAVSGTYGNTPACVIPKGQSTCFVNVNWTTQYASTAQLYITGNTSSIASGLSGSYRFNGVSPSSSTNFTLEVQPGNNQYSNNVRATCESGSVWNGSICASDSTGGTTTCSFPLVAVGGVCKRQCSDGSYIDASATCPTVGPVGGSACGVGLSSASFFWTAPLTAYVTSTGVSSVERSMDGGSSWISFATSNGTEVFPAATIPPGTYTAMLRGVKSDGTTIACVPSAVTFTSKP